jgi:hypothetical protein
VLLGFGPYQALRPLPRLDELPVPQVSSASVEPLLVIAVEGLAVQDAAHLPVPPPLQVLSAALADATPLAADGAAAHPAAFWNEIATGQPARRHGLRDAAAPVPRGMDTGVGGLRRDPVWATLSQHVLPGMGLAPTQAADQRELLLPPVWEVAARAGRRCLVVNWWATYPAARHPSLEVASDRWFLRLWDGDTAALDDPLLRAPDTLAALAGPLTASAATAGDPGPAGGWPPLAVARGDSLVADAAEASAATLVPLARAWHLATRADAYHAGVATRALREGGRDLVLLHLNGLDILDRRLQASASGLAGDPALARAATALRDLQVTALDALLAEALRAAPGRVLVLGSAWRHGQRSAWAWTPRPQQFDAFPGACLEVAAEILAELGIAPPADAPAPGGGATGAWSLPRPATYGRRPAWTPPAPRAAEDLEALRSLGYIGGD